MDDDEDEQRAKQHIEGLEEITGPYVAGVVVEESGPGLIGSARSSDLTQIRLNRALAHPDMQFEQLPANALCSPGSGQN